MTFVFFCTLTSVLSLFFGAFCFVKRRAHPANQAFFINSITISLWSLGLGWMSVANSQSGAEQWLTIHYIGATLIPPSFAMFVYAFLRMHPRRTGLIYFWWSGGLLFFVLSISPYRYLFISAVAGSDYFHFYTKAGIFYLMYTVFFFSAIGDAILLLVQSVTRKSHLSKTHIQYVLVASLVGFGGGSTAFLTVYFPSIYPAGMYIVFLYPLIMTYAIVVHKLMDVEVLVKKSLVFAGLFTSLMAVVSGVSTAVQSVVGQRIGLDETAIRILSILIAMVLFDPVRKYLVRVTDRYLFQKNENVRVILNRLSQNIITILDIEKVGTTILETLKDSLRLESGIILIQDEDGKTFEIMDSFGIQNKHERFPKEGLFIRCFLESDKILNLEDPLQKESLPSAIKGTLEAWGAVICIPLFIHRELIGLLILGKKKSDQEFSEDEMDCFPAVAGQVAIALSNARLYHILMRSQADFAQQAKMAAIGTLSAGISHEIKNPLQVIRGIVEMLRFNKKSGIYKDYTKEQYEELIAEALVRVLDAVNRATGVIDRLSSFAKKPKELKTELFSLEHAMDNALNMVTYEFEQNQITVKKEYASNLPKVLADEHAIEEVFFNLLINARHAIIEKGTIEVQMQPQGDEIEALIRDTGSGIPKENLEKIFDPFFTTKDTSRNPDDAAIKGSGLGLFLVREIVKRYGGRIVLESEVGKGTTFHIFLPASPDPRLKN